MSRGRCRQGRPATLLRVWVRIRVASPVRLSLRRVALAAASVLCALNAATVAIAQERARDESAVPFPPYDVEGDAIRRPLTAVRGDATRGRALVGNRQTGLCLLCHSGPFPDRHLQGTLAPDLAGAGARWSEGQLRLRLVDPRRLDPAALMPAYGVADSHARVGAAWRGRTVLTPQQIEDVVAYLRTLDR